MTRLAASERSALCDSALQVGEDRPTLCDGWTVKDLVVHLVVRERSPAAIGIAVPPLARFTEAASARVGRRSFTDLVETVRSGPPRLSPVAIPRIDELTNGLELFVHHEDIRRAQPGWSPRDLGEETDRALWSMARARGRLMARRSPVGLAIQDSTTGATTMLRKGTPAVTVKGSPGEVALYLLGRSAHARVELVGPDDAVRRLAATSLAV
jgi:uncharacterized protein (TIGR03085 family)